ncbi:MAG TPA: R3H domain-containing nucleic acid-binding protein [Acidobacteriaceae bacterium]
MPIEDLKAAAQTIAGFLKLLTAPGALRLRYRITAGPGAADPDGFEAREIYVELAGPDAGLVTARNGELLRALEHVAGKIIRLEAEEHDRVSFDAENFKALRARELKRSAERAVEEVRATGRPCPFAPMSSRERRMLHLAFRSFEDVETESVGEGPQRALVVFPKGYDHARYEAPQPTAYARPGGREMRRR